MTVDIIFITLSEVKTLYGFTDTQDDVTLQEITDSANSEISKSIAGVVDNATISPEFLKKGKSIAFVFAESEIRRQINQMYDDAEKIMKKFKLILEPFVDDLKSIAPVRSSRQVITRDVPFEDDYFAERHVP